MAAGFTGEKAVVQAFVHPLGSSQRSFVSQAPSIQSSLPMSVSLPDDSFAGGSSSWGDPNDNGSPKDGLPESGSDSSSRRYTTNQYNGIDGAFPLPDDMETPETRQLRWEREALLQSKFASGDELFELRQSVDALRTELYEVRSELDDYDGPELELKASKRRIAVLEKELYTLNGRDAEFMYAVSLELLEAAQIDGDIEAEQKYRIQMEEARLCIPQLNMHGLWVGKYGEHGYEMINVTYTGDVLVATKVTGDKNVPKGEVSFTVDLSPQYQSSASGYESLTALEPIELNPKAAKQWGKRFLPRHLGKGQVAGLNFENAQWMEGQLIQVGRFFSFAWVPIGHQVFFGRPSSELTLKMLKQAKDEELRKDHVAVMREVAESMWDETYWEQREGEHLFAEEGAFE